MQLGILKIRIIIVLCISVVGLLILSCVKKTNMENQITIKINSIDSKTKQYRINALDTIVVKMVKFGYLKKNFVTVGEYITDSTGSVNIKLDSTEEYHISLYGRNVFGWANFKENDLKNCQEINIEASPPEIR